MTTNQTIDGVPGLRDLLERLHAEHVSIAGPGFWAAWKELRALLDATDAGISASPAAPKPTGLSQGWNLTRKHDGFVVGHQSMAYPPDEKAIQRAERGGYVWVPFLVPAKPVPSCISDLERFESDGEDFVKVSDVIDILGNLKASQHQGEPIYQVKHLVSGDRGWIDVTKDRYEASQNPCWCTRIVYAEQPAPVAVVMPERRADAATEDQRTWLRGWNAYRDELKRLNPSL